MNLKFFHIKTLKFFQLKKGMRNKSSKFMNFSPFLTDLENPSLFASLNIKLKSQVEQ